MKRVLTYILVTGLALTAILSGCGGNGSNAGQGGKRPAGVKEILESGMAAAPFC